MAKPRLIIKNVRFVYPHVFEPDTMSGKYSVRVLIPKNSPQLGEIKDLIQTTAAEGADILKGKKVSWSDTLHDGDALEGGGEAYQGHYYLNAKSKDKPGLVKVNTAGLGGKTTQITDPTEFYSGCYGWVSLGFFAFNQVGKYGVGAALNNILKTGGEDGQGNGPVLGGGRKSAEADFGEDLSGDGYDF